MLSVLCLWLLAAPEASPPPEPMRLGVGTQKVLELPGLERVGVDGDAISVRFLGSNHLLVIGEAKGLASLLVFAAGKPERIPVRVGRIGPEGDVICEICKLLPESGTLDIKMVGDRIYIEGFADRIEDFDRARQITKLYPNVKVWAGLSEKAIRTALLEIDFGLWRAGYLEARAHVVGRGVEIANVDPNDPRAVAAARSLAQPLEDALLAVDPVSHRASP